MGSWRVEIWSSQVTNNSTVTLYVPDTQWCGVVPQKHDSTSGRPASNSALGRGPKLTEGLEVYLRLKGVGRPDTFEAGARRSIG